MVDYGLYEIIDIDFPLSSHVNKYYNVLMLFERFSARRLLLRNYLAQVT